LEASAIIAPSAVAAPLCAAEPAEAAGTKSIKPTAAAAAVMIDFIFIADLTLLMN
jgi:hypothetical protein